MEDLGPIGSDWPTRQKMKHDQPLTWFWRAASAHSCQCSMMLNALMTFQCLKFTRTWRSWNRKLPKSLRATQARDWCSLVFCRMLFNAFSPLSWRRKLLDDQKSLSRREEGARCSLPIANSFLTCLSGLVSKLWKWKFARAGLKRSEAQQVHSAHSLWVFKSISSQFLWTPANPFRSAQLGTLRCFNLTHTWRSWNGRLPKDLHGHLSITTCCRRIALGATNTMK